MKKQLLTLAAAMALVPSFSANAQAEIEQVWLYQNAILNDGWDGTAPNWASEDAIKSKPCARFATGKDGRMYTINMMAMSIAEVTKDGLVDLYKLPSLEGIAYDGKPDYYGTAISMDDAGNFLVGHYFTVAGLSSQIYTVYNTATGEAKHFDLGYPEGTDAETYASPGYGTGVGLGRIDVVGRVCGDFSNEAVFFIAPQGQGASVAQNIRFVYAYAGGDFKDLSLDANEYVGTYLGTTSVTNIVQPAITNISEYGETVEDHSKAYILNSTEGGKWDVIGCGAGAPQAGPCFNVQTAMRNTPPSKNNGFDTFLFDGKRYFVHGRNVVTADGATTINPNNTAPMDIAVWDEDGNIVAEWANPDYASNAGYNSIVAQAVEEEGFAYIHVYVSTGKMTVGNGEGCGAAAVLKFYPNGSAGIEAVEVDNNNAPAVYYNLQGVEVANPENGIYVVRRGNKVTKEIVR